MRRFINHRATAFLFLLILLLLTEASLFAQSTAFTYQGLLQDGGAVANRTRLACLYPVAWFSANTQRGQVVTMTRDDTTHGGKNEEE